LKNLLDYIRLLSMKILAIETSTKLGGVSIMDEEEGLIAEIRLNVEATHSERLMTLIDQALKRSSLDIGGIDLFAISIGPGSFTGLRIGLSTVKGLAFATEKPVVEVPTLEAFAWNFPFSPYPVCTMLDARKKEVYAAVFIWKNGHFERVLGEVSIKPLELLETLRGPVILTGEGVTLYRDMITDVLGDDALYPPPQYMIPSPSNVAYLGLRKARSGEISDPKSLIPLYIRKSEAEIKLPALS
jgi:tRNA threonylcarbamoyladenosine biosynthesis protein TsaB